MAAGPLVPPVGGGSGGGRFDSLEQDSQPAKPGESFQYFLLDFSFYLENISYRQLLGIQTG
jgi:hypothetical protein